MSDLHLTNFDVHRDERGLMTAILNVADQPINVFNESVLRDLDGLIRAIELDGSVTAVVFRSGKESGFLAGADLRVIESLNGPEIAEHICQSVQELFGRLENLSVPTIAVIQGVCLGGGLEFALACRYRVVVDDPRTRLGFPEVEVGLLPGWGGTQRLPRRVGLTAALPILLTGKKVNAPDAVRIGLADAICPPTDVDNTLVRLLDSSQSPSPGHPQVLAASFAERFFQVISPQRIWKGFCDQTSAGQKLSLWFAQKSIASKAKHYPALRSILKAVQAGLRGSSEHGFETERHEFSRLMMTDTHRNLLRLFFLRECARKPETWVPKSKSPSRRIKTVGVVGGGAMGASIAHWASIQGFDVILKEVSANLLDASQCRIRDLFDESVHNRAISASDASRWFSTIQITTDWREFSRVDLVIEAVTEKLDVKQSVFRELDLYCPAHAIFTSNTSALSIQKIATALPDPKRVLGLHFFNPVHRMPLIEIVRTPESQDSDVALLVEFVKKLGKVPVVASDHPGFVVNRILFPYFEEAIRLQQEGASAESIDRAMVRFGMPTGPLELLDHIGIDVAADVAISLPVDHEHGPVTSCLQEMVNEGQLGRKSGRGFYNYNKPGGHRTTAVRVGRSESLILDVEIRDRLTLRLINEAAKCLEEGVVTEAWMIDLAMVLGTGFAPFTGGPLTFAQDQREELVCKLNYYQTALGSRFRPSTWLLTHADGRPHVGHSA
ncbi:3-hydroxyacyl-CoA dehydrogenase NAD-binding domain-containing protein [Schlesneria paludicola]|uniref:3-hydroxyacyl-CoA dehydrogenase NAD-binding domain-containing protein n=1 Tax=Schlesneria paludicola TaxID=360056 RepID=UPI00029A0BC2|nr:3-hydroxyacyl-CoA dehydrogenase NAD-binding domain-containing protein [Schlesneria paludicola]